MRSSLTATSRRSPRVRALAFAAFAAFAAGVAVPASVTTLAAETPVAAAPVVGTPNPPLHNPHGEVLGIVPSRPTSPRPSSFSTSSNQSRPRAAANAPVTYHGGPVMHSSAVYAIFWVPSGYALPANYQNTISQYFTDLDHDSYLTSNVYGTTVQYYETGNKAKRFVSYNVVNKAAGNEAKAFPKSGCPNYTLGDSTPTKVCLTRAQIEKEIAAVVSSHHLPTGLGTQIFLFTPQGVGSCVNATALTKGGCYNPRQYNGYCAFHSHIGSGDRAVLYANMPYNAIQGCASGQSPNGNAADAVLNNVAHEHNETITDPLGTGWYDSGGNEIADKCHLKFGSALGSTATGQYNQVINGHGYWLQTLWSNRARACVSRNNFSQPSVSFTYSPSTPRHGKRVVFRSNVKQAGETKWSYRWTFPDGGTATVANPTHVFQGFVFAGEVALLVTDRHGDQTRFTRTITVQ